MPEDSRSRDLMAWTTEIVAAHLRRTAVPLPDLDQFIRPVYQTLAGLSGGGPANRPEPAVPIKKSVMPEHIVCLEDGRKLKMLKRHLSTAYGMTPEQYRERWDCRRTTRWWRPIMPASAAAWPRRSVWAAADAGDERARRSPLPAGWESDRVWTIVRPNLISRSWLGTCFLGLNDGVATRA